MRFDFKSPETTATPETVANFQIATALGLI